MKFGSIEYLWVLWIVPVVVFFYVWAHKRKQYLIDQFVSEPLKRKLLAGVSFRVQKVNLVIVFYTHISDDL